MRSRLVALPQFGQSPWYDNIERSLILSGRLKKMIEEDGISGLTSNPTIFEKAINGSTAYDEEIKRHFRSGKLVEEIYDELTSWDIKQAAELLWETYQSSRSLDGYVSIEVSPHLAHDIQTTILEAKRIFYKVGKENLLIKVPATPEGIEAIRQLIAEGININATLIFSKSHYRRVAEAYLEGLKTRANQGKDISKIASVASFFVSRIDTYVDKLLEEKGVGEELKGKAAVAQAKVLYEIYQQIFSNSQFRELQNQGAKVQRLLFGSTSTKNPTYSDVKYVEEIIGPGTINTIPQITLDAFRDHGVAKATLGGGIEEAKKTLKRLKELGIEVEEVCQKIQDDGVQAFIDSYDKLLKSLADKKEKFIHS